MSTTPSAVAPSRPQSRKRHHVPLEGEVGRSYAFGFVLSDELRLDWGMRLSNTNLQTLRQRAKTDHEYEALLRGVAGFILRILPPYIARQVPGLPRLAGRRWNRLRLVDDDFHDTLFIFVVKHNGTPAARDLVVPKEVLDQLKEKLRVDPQQEPKWYRIVS